MAKQSATGTLKEIPISSIVPNPENPRIVFRQSEMEDLMRSIDRYGVQVPITVFQENDSYVLLDGERRWRCSKKLGLEKIPALIKPAPSELDNLKLMYNIHALREQWDYFTIANKLDRLLELLREEIGGKPTESQIVEATGLQRNQIRRCFLIMNLPARFKEMIRAELEKPKAKQRLTEDFFLEMEGALKALFSRLPEYQEHADDIRDALIKKFKAGTINAVTDFRSLKRIAYAIDSLGVAQRTARIALDRVFDPSEKFGIREAYEETVQFEYLEKKIGRSIEHINEFLGSVIEDERIDDLDDDIVDALRVLRSTLDQFL